MFRCNFYDDAKVRKKDGLRQSLMLKLLFDVPYMPRYRLKCGFLTGFYAKYYSMSVFFTNFARFFVEGIPME